MASKFANVPKVVASTSPEAKKDTAPRVPIAQMEALAALEFEIAALTAFRDTIKADIKAVSFVHWIDEGSVLGRAPLNFKGTENGAEGSCELRIKPSNRVLPEEVVTLMNNAGLPVAKQVLVEKTIRVNPIHSGNEKLMNRVWDAVQRIKDLPEDFWQQQEESSYPYVGKGAIDTLFRLVKDEDLCREDAEVLLPLITEPSFGKTKLGKPSRMRAREIIAAIVGDDSDDEEEI